MARLIGTSLGFSAHSGRMRLAIFPDRRRAGLMLVETAIIILLIILLTFGVMEYAWMFMQAQHVMNAARQGARIGVRADSVNGDATSAIGSLLSAQGITNYAVAFSPSDVSAPVTPSPFLSAGRHSRSGFLTSIVELSNWFVIPTPDVRNRAFATR